MNPAKRILYGVLELNATDFFLIGIVKSNFRRSHFSKNGPFSLLILLNLFATAFNTVYYEILLATLSTLTSQTISL